MRKFIMFIGMLLAFSLVVIVPAQAAPHLVGDSLAFQTYNYVPRSYGWVYDTLPGRPLHGNRPLIASHSGHGVGTLIVALGSNDVYKNSNTMRSDIAYVMGLPAPCTVLTTVKVDGVFVQPLNPNWAANARRWNRHVWHSGATVANWNGIARNHPEWFLPDGLHLTNSGMTAYNNVIRRAVSRTVCQ